MNPTAKGRTKLGLAIVLGLAIGGGALAAGLPTPAPTKVVVPPMTAREAANVKLVEDWWRIVIENGHLEYVPKYQAETYIQHNPGISTGRAAFLKVFSDGNKPTNPIAETLSEDVPLAAGRGDFVWMMREFTAPDKAHPGRTLYRDGFDVLRVDHGQIQEHWDVAHRDKDDPVVIYGRSPGPPSTYPTGTLTPQEQAERAVAIEAAETVYVKHDIAAMKRLFAPDYVEHFWKLSDPSTFAADLQGVGPGTAALDTKPVLALVNGDYVFMMWAAQSPDPTDATKTYPWFTYQLMRVTGGKVVEHWQSS